MDNRGHRRWKASRNRYHFIPWQDPPLFQKRRGQRHKSQQIGRGTGIYNTAIPDSQPLRKLLFKPGRVTSCRKPEFQGAVRQIHHFRLVVDAAGIRDSVPGDIFFSAGAVLLTAMVRPAVFPYQLQNLLPGLGFTFIFKYAFLHCHTLHGTLPLSQSFSKYALSRILSMGIQKPSCLYALIWPSMASLSKGPSSSISLPSPR